MFSKIRNRVEGDQGFTLIELLVVILIIGILAAIAIPSFLNQREKGQDVCAKSMLRTMQTGMETYYTDNSTYATATLGKLNGIETAIPNGPACGGVAGNTPVIGAAGAAGCASAAPGVDNYCVGMLSTNNNRSFALHRSAAGVILRTCGDTIAATTNGGGCAAGTW